MPILFSIVRAITGDPAPGARLCFRPTSWMPSNLGGDVNSSSDLVITASNVGFWRTAIQPGQYFVWIGGGTRRLIVVPETPEYIMLGDLFSGQSGSASIAGENYRLSSAERQLINADSGDFQTIFIDDVAGLKEIAFVAPGAGSAVANFRYRSGMLELFCAETNTWHAPYLDDGALTLAADGSTPQIVDRIVAGRWQLKDITTGLYRTWFITGSVGSETLAFGPEES